MKKQEENESLPGPFRVPDLTGEKGFLWGRILGDLGVETPAPCLGQHNEHVYTKMSGMPDQEFVELLREGVFN